MADKGTRSGRPRKMHPNSLKNLIKFEEGFDERRSTTPRLLTGAHRRTMFQLIGDIALTGSDKIWKDIEEKYPEIKAMADEHYGGRVTVYQLAVMRIYREAILSSNPVPALKEIFDRMIGSVNRPLEAAKDDLDKSLEDMPITELLTKLDGLDQFTASYVLPSESSEADVSAGTDSETGEK